MLREFHGKARVYQIALSALARTLAAHPACLYAPDDAVDLRQRMGDQLRAPVISEVEIPSWREQAARLEGLLAEVAAR